MRSLTASILREGREKSIISSEGNKQTKKLNQFSRKAALKTVLLHCSLL